LFDDVLAAAEIVFSWSVDGNFIYFTSDRWEVCGSSQRTGVTVFRLLMTGLRRF
jgi:hypothetical protein